MESEQGSKNALRALLFPEGQRKKPNRKTATPRRNKGTPWCRCRILRKASRSQQKQTLDRIPWYVNRIVPNNCVSHFRWESDLGLIERHSEQVHSVALRNQYGTGLKPCSRTNDCTHVVLIPDRKTVC